MQPPCPLFHHPTPDPNSTLPGRKLQLFTDSGTLVVRPWPKPATWRNGKRVPWEGFHLHFELHSPNEYSFAALDRPTPWDELMGPWPQFFGAIPLEVREALCLYRFHQPRMLSFIGHCDGAIDLVTKNPALAVALAMHTRFHEPVVKHPLPAARRWVQKEQRDILGWLGFPATERARRVLARVTKDLRSTAALLLLRDALWDEKRAEFLARLPTVNGSAVGALADGTHISS